MFAPVIIKTQKQVTKKNHIYVRYRDGKRTETRNIVFTQSQTFTTSMIQESVKMIFVVLFLPFFHPYECQHFTRKFLLLVKCLKSGSS